MGARPTPLSARQAAAHLGVGETTFRRWILSGKLRAAPVEGTYRSAPADLEALPPGAPPADPPPPGAHPCAPVSAPPGAPPPRHVSDPAVVALCDRLSRENVELAGRMGFLQAKLQDAEARIRLFEAPREVDPAPAEMALSRCGEAVAPHSTAEKPTRRPRWAFWRFREAG